VVHPNPAAAGGDGGGIVQVVLQVDITGDGGEIPAPLDHPIQSAQIGLDEIVPQEQGLRGIAGDGQLGKSEQIDAQGLGTVNHVDDPGRVTGQIAHGAVDLSKTDAHDTHAVPLFRIPVRHLGCPYDLFPPPSRWQRRHEH